MFINGGLADAQLLGNVTEGVAVAKVQFDNLPADGRREPADAFGQHVQLLGKVLGRSDGDVCIEHVEPGYAFLNLPVADYVHTSVSYASEQKRLCGVFPHIARVGEKLGKDVVHHVFAFRIIVQKQDGQPVHLPIMPHEQRLKVLCPVCHTLYIHTKNDLLNPRGGFFLFKLQR